MVSPKLRDNVTRLYENAIPKLKTTEGWSEEITWNIIFKQGFPLFPTLFGIYIDNLLEDRLEDTRCDGPRLIGMVITLLLYDGDIILLARSHDDLNKQLRILQYYCSNMGMICNTNKTKLMIIKSKNMNYDNFIYDHNDLEKISSYKYLGIDIHCHLN